MSTKKIEGISKNYFMTICSSAALIIGGLYFQRIEFIPALIGAFIIGMIVDRIARGKNTQGNMTEAEREIEAKFNAIFPDGIID